jgi:tetratricopeptide (TPR) repeat protein
LQLSGELKERAFELKGTSPPLDERAVPLSVLAVACFEGMSRTLLLKLLYVAAVAAFGGLALLIVTTAFRGREKLGAVMLAVLLLVPGPLLGFFFRSLFQGRRLLDAGQPKPALDHFRAFLDQVRESPWQKRLIWLSWAVYTPDVEAMAWNNIGAAHTELGNWDDAKQAFSEALAVDPKYALPHLNLARIAIVEGDKAEAERRVDSARSLGYKKTSVDQLIFQGQALLARVEGRGAIDPKPQRRS